MSAEFQVSGQNAAALFTLKLHRGDGMALLAMNWKSGKPPTDFVGFAIEYKEPGGDKFFALKNRLPSPAPTARSIPNRLSTRLSPIQKFRWVHFPRNAELAGEFVYRVTPVFMNDADELSYGEAQEAAIELRRETYPGPAQRHLHPRLRVVAGVRRPLRVESAPISTLLPAKADDGLDFVPTHPEGRRRRWRGWASRRAHAILEVLDQAIADKKAAGPRRRLRPERARRRRRGSRSSATRLKIIIDDDGAHGEAALRRDPGGEAPARPRPARRT